MTDHASPGRPAAKPFQDLRITFWGVQGSCPVAPPATTLCEYARRSANQTLVRFIDLMQRKGRDGRCSIEELLDGPPTRTNIEACQRRLGLADQPLYGGDTTCVQIETAEGDVLIFDAGSGLRRCSHPITEAAPDQPGRTVHIFGSHEHLDHRSGLTFARFCYVRSNPFNINIYGPRAFLAAIDQRYGIFSRKIGIAVHTDDPVDYTLMPANFAGTIILPNGADPTGPWRGHVVDAPIQIGQTTVTPFEAYHSFTTCLAYKVEHGGKKFIFCTDHELRRGESGERQDRSAAAEERLRNHCQNADLLYVDGQYWLDEYLGQKPLGPYPPMLKVDWGHGCIEDAIDRAVQCNIARTLVGHHDPERSWAERCEIDQKLIRLSEGKKNRIQLADSDLVVDL